MQFKSTPALRKRDEEKDKVKRDDLANQTQKTNLVTVTTWVWFSWSDVSRIDLCESD